MPPSDIAQKAFENIFPDSDKQYSFNITYTNRLKNFGSNVCLSGGVMEFKLSKKWFSISDEIKMGLMQELMLKLFKAKKQSMYVDLYNNFIRALHVAIPKDKSDPLLEESFKRINEKYFLGLVEQPNLVWGGFSTRTFGSYDFKTDTIRISSIFHDEEPVFLDYIMFHETLHKQRKFFKSGNKTYYHDKRFKRLEKVFENSDQIEKALGKLARRARVRAGAMAAFGQKPVLRKKKGLFGWF
jgi:hypothetical protein